MSSASNLKSAIGQIASLLIMILIIVAGSTGYAIGSSGQSSSSSNTLSSHWVPGWGYRDELNASDADYQNFWTDNAGKILTMSMITGDSLDATRSFSFIQSHFFNSSQYLPELVINSSSPLIKRAGNGAYCNEPNRRNNRKQRHGDTIQPARGWNLLFG